MLREAEAELGIFWPRKSTLARYMKIIFNARSLLPPRTGVGLYTQNLIEALLETRGADDFTGFLGGNLLRDGSLRNFIQGSPSSATGSLVARRRRLAVPRRLARSLPGAYEARHHLSSWFAGRKLAPLARGGAIYHEPNYIPVDYSGPLVITVHDLSHIRFPHFHPPERVAFLNKHLAMSLHRADRVVTVSNFVANELKEIYSVPEQKLFVTPLGVSADYRPRLAEEVNPLLSELNLRYRGFVLSVATIEPRKNVERLVEAYISLPLDIRKSFPLVLVGAKGWKYSAFLSRLQKKPAGGEIIHTGYIPHSQLVQLYSAAAVFAYPSLYEGFGLPVLEAFASGTPTLTSNVTSLPELSNGAAVEVDPNALDAIADGLYRLISDSSLARQHATLGQERARTFSWRLCAQLTFDVYSSIL